MHWHRFSVQDNDSYAFREHQQLTKNRHAHQILVPDLAGTTREWARRCETCGELISKWSESLRGLIIKNRRFDVAITYDGVITVSRRFRSVYDENALFGLVFQGLPDDSAFEAIQATRFVEFDAAKRDTRFINQCEMCGIYESVVGATPVYLKEGLRIDPKEIVRTDLEFGSGDEKHPLILCGEKVAEVLMSARMKGLDVIAI